MKKQIMSIAAIAAILTTGANAFDMQTTGAIVADITASTIVPASYTGGFNAGIALAKSNGRQGNALIYPAFKSADGWSTEISLRNTKDVAIIAKAVLYAQDNSRELLDFNLYLSPHDAVKFTISDGVVTSSDGSIAAKVTDPRAGVVADRVQFASKAEPFSANFASSAPAGYVVIYAMMEQSTAVPGTATTAEALIYHEKHKEIFEDYRKTLDVCRGTIAAGAIPASSGATNATLPNWRKAFNLTRQATHVNNGTAVNLADTFLAPNQANACTLDAANALFLAGSAWQRNAAFTSPAADALFGEVSISHNGDKRSLLLPATALSNYVAPGQVMLWAEGEYASIQDRRITAGAYVPAHILIDAATFVVNQTYYTFDKTTGDENEATLLLTQPMKRALQMANQGNNYWNVANRNIAANQWADFKISRTPWTDDEGTLAAVSADIPFGSLNSPVDGAAAPLIPGGYQSELTALNYTTLTSGFESVFENGDLAGYIDIVIPGAVAGSGLPAIVTEMTSTDVDGESQINWIYSATN